LLWVAGSFPVPLILLPLGAQPALAGGGGGSGPPTYVNALRHYYTDHLGSTHLVTAPNGDVLEHIRYTTWGGIRGRYGANLNPPATSENIRYMFTGYENESYSGLQYAGARFYDPATAAFLSHDPVRRFANPYGYAAWDPVNLTDPNGTDPVSIGIGLGILLAALIGAAVSAAQAAANGASAGDAITAGLIGGAIGAFTAVGLGVVAAAVQPYAVLSLSFKLATIASGAYGVVGGFQSGQYIAGAVGVVMLAYGLYGLGQGARVGGSSPSSGTAGGSNLDPRPLTPAQKAYLENLHGRSFDGVTVDEGFLGERWAAGQVRSDAEINVETGFSQYSPTDQLGLLGHEGTHIVQRDLGILNNFNGFFKHAGAALTGTDLYAIPSDYSGSFWDLNFEQQAVIVENVGRLSLGQSSTLFPHGGNLSVPRTLGLYMEYRGVISR
jgi:RHS repeat-associated protein